MVIQGVFPRSITSCLHSTGTGVLAWDFRAHGKSEGEISTLGYNEELDVKAALDFALAQPGVMHVGVWGGPMGTAAGIRASAEYPEIEVVVADSAYPTLKEVTEMRPPPMLRPLVRLFGLIRTNVDLEWMRPVDDVARISPRPVFIIQGSDDRNIPAGSAAQLYQAAGEPRFLWVEEGVGHMGMYPRFGKTYADRVMAFFDEALLAP